MFALVRLSLDKVSPLKKWQMVDLGKILTKKMSRLDEKFCLALRSTWLRAGAVVKRDGKCRKKFLPTRKFKLKIGFWKIATMSKQRLLIKIFHFGLAALMDLLLQSYRHILDFSQVIIFILCFVSKQHPLMRLQVSPGDRVDSSVHLEI